MEELRELFGEGALTFAEFTNALAADGVKDRIKLVNLANGEHVAKGRFESKSRELDGAKAEVEALKDALKAFDGVDVEALKQSAADWERRYNEDMNALKRSHAIYAALTEAGARDTRAVAALLDGDAIKFEGGVITGLDEQIAKLKETHGWAFEDETESDEPTAQTIPPKAGSHISQPPNSGNGVDLAAIYKIRDNGKG